METLLSLAAGIMDGIRVDEDGNLTEIMNAMPLGWNVADFEYLPGQSLLLIPTFLDNRVRAVRIRR